MTVDVTPNALQTKLDVVCNKNLKQIALKFTEVQMNHNLFLCLNITILATNYQIALYLYGKKVF